MTFYHIFLDRRIISMALISGMVKVANGELKINGCHGKFYQHLKKLLVTKN